MEVLVFKDIKNNRWTLWTTDRKKHLGYMDDLVLQKCSLIVDNTKRKKVVKTKKRFPHAWIIGTLTKKKKVMARKQISYNPFKNDTFISGNRPCFSSKEIYFSKEGKVFKA